MPRSLKRAHHRTPAAALIVATVIWTTPHQAHAQNVETRPWNEIVLVVGHDVALTLPDGYISGEALAVTPDALEIDVQKTTNGSTYPKGRTTIARSLISVIRLRKSDGRAPRVASQTIGQAAVLGGLFGLGSRSGVRGSLRNAGIQIAAATVGTAIGRRLDDRQIETLIRIAPEPGVDAERTQRP